MTESIGDSLKEYGFVFAAALAGIIFAQKIIIGEPGNIIDFTVLPVSVTIGYAAGRKIRDSMGKSTSDERDIQNYESGMTWGFIAFAAMTALQTSQHITLATTDILMLSVSIAFTATLYLEIRQSGLKGLMRR